MSGTNGTKTRRTKRTFEEIRVALHSHLPELERRFGIISLEAFGSYVRCE